VFSYLPHTQVIVPFIVGHVTARVDLNTLQFNIQSSNPALVDGVADITIQV